jgi:hypothetical protein
MPAPGAIQVGESGTQVKEQRDKYPGADIWQVPADGHTQWRQLRVHADSSGHLEEALRATALGGGLVMPK